MPRRVVRTERVSQPQGPTGVAADYLSGLLFAYHGASDTIVDGTRRVRSGTYSRVATAAGVAAQASGGTNFVTIDDTPTFAASQVTILVVGQRRNASSVNALTVSYTHLTLPTID